MTTWLSHKASLLGHLTATSTRGHGMQTQYIIRPECLMVSKAHLIARTVQTHKTSLQTEQLPQWHRREPDASWSEVRCAATTALPADQDKKSRWKVPMQSSHSLTLKSWKLGGRKRQKWGTWISSLLLSVRTESIWAKFCMWVSTPMFLDLSFLLAPLWAWFTPASPHPL